MVVYVYWSQLSQFILLFHFYKLFFSLRLEKLEQDVSFSGHYARRQKRLKAKETRQTATKRQMVSHPLHHLNDSVLHIKGHGKSFSLLLCHYAFLVFVVESFFLLHHCSSSFWANRSFSFFFLFLLFYVASWVISNIRRRGFLYVVVDLGVFQIL